jgi:hypothetical protein
LLNCFFKEIRIDRAFNDLTERIECVNHVPKTAPEFKHCLLFRYQLRESGMARMAGDLLMPEKSAAWLEAECLRRCRLLALRRHLEAVKIQRIKPTGNGPNWQVAAFKPERDGVAYQKTMRVIAHLRGTYALEKGRTA